MHDFKEGDIFYWHYKDKPTDGAWGVYHCKSQIAVMRNGLLVDTYWSGYSDSTRFKPGDGRIELRFISNIEDLEPKDEMVANYYDDAEIVNLNHANSSRGNFYIRKGAKRSPEKMIEAIRYKKEKAEAEIRSANWTIERLDKSLKEINDGGDLEQIYI